MRAGRSVIVARGISKRFGRTVALDGVDFDAKAGEIHALIGENGAGKSTFLNIVAGRVAPDSGTIDVGGAARSTHTARRKSGVAAVFQSPMLFERLSWEENLALGNFSGQRWTIDKRTVATNAGRLAQELGFALPPPNKPIARCSISERVRLEILRALSFNPQVLMLDEPTSVLSIEELEQFLEMLRRLRTNGRAVVIVTHKLAEALAIADRITVLRHGKKVAGLKASETNEEELAALMIGELPPLLSDGRGCRQSEIPTLILDHLLLDREGKRLLDGVSLEIYPGEIVGIAGVDGNGQADLVAVIARVISPTSGRIEIKDNQRMAVIPQNRDSDGLVLEMSLWENVLLVEPIRRQFTRACGLMAKNGAIKFCRDLIERFSLRASGAEAPAASLSGGNRQRLLIARALAIDPEMIVAHDLTRGLDLRVKSQVHARLRQYASDGGAVLLISTDLAEVFELCNRNFVISRGRLRAMTTAEREAAQIGLMMGGARG